MSGIVRPEQRIRVFLTNLTAIYSHNYNNYNYHPDTRNYLLGTLSYCPVHGDNYFCLLLLTCQITAFRKMILKKKLPFFIVCKTLLAYTNINVHVDGFFVQFAYR